MTEIIKFKSTDGKFLGETRQNNIPRHGEIVFIDNCKYSVEKVVWVYSDPRDTYPEDHLTSKDVFVFLNFIVGYPKKAKNVFSELSVNVKGGKGT